MWFRDNFAPLLGITTALGFITVTLVLCFHAVPTESQDIVMAMTGVLATTFGAVVGYHFGSSAGSAKKTEIMAKNGTKE